MISTDNLFYFTDVENSSDNVCCEVVRAFDSSGGVMPANATEVQRSEIDLNPTVQKVPADLWAQRFKGGTHYFLGRDRKANGTRPTEALFADQTGKRLILGESPWQSQQEIEQICNEVKESYRALNALSLQQRADLGLLFCKYLRKDSTIQTLAITIMLETGKTLKDATTEVVRTAEFIEGYVQVLLKAWTEEEVDGHRVRFMGKGLAAHFGPSNYPINEGVTVVVAKLLAGNPTVWKSPSTCMASAHCFEQLVIKPTFEEFVQSVPAFPMNCVGLLYSGGKDIAPIIARMSDQICYIGSEAGKEAIWRELDKCRGTSDRIFAVSTMNPYIVLKGNHAPGEVAKQLMAASYGNRGERCTAPGLIFLPRSEADSYLDPMIAIAKEYKLGAPWEAGITITSPSEGAVKNRAVLDEVTRAVATKEATMRYPSKVLPVDGILPPILLCIEHLDAEIARDEPFGVLTKIYIYDDSCPDWMDGVLAYYKRINRGQQVAVFGPAKEAETIAESFVGITGGIFINTPGGRGPDSLPFEHLGEAGFGSLSGYASLYWESVRPLRWTIKK